MMILLLRKILGLLPWILLVLLLSWLLAQEKLFPKDPPVSKETHQSAILNRMEKIGKMELVKYNFKEITEVKKITEYIDLRIFKYKPAPDSKAVLISSGTAAGCIDLGKASSDRIWEEKDTLYVQLPAPELCYFKLELDKSRIYDLQIDYLSKEEQAKFMEQLYTEAEKNIKISALNQGILDQTKENAETILTPLFENLSGKKIIIRFDNYPDEVTLDTNK